MTDLLHSIHAQWCASTGQELKYPPCERMLYDFVKSDFTADDLRCVLVFIIWQNKKREPQYRERLLFHKIVGDLETFNSRRGEAKAWERNRRSAASPREKVLEQFRGASPGTSGNVRHISEVFKSIT
jgi:hypothetical protein